MEIPLAPFTKGGSVYKSPFLKGDFFKAEFLINNTLIKRRLHIQYIYFAIDFITIRLRNIGKIINKIGDEPYFGRTFRG